MIFIMINIKLICIYDMRSSRNMGRISRKILIVNRNRFRYDLGLNISRYKF